MINRFCTHQRMLAKMNKGNIPVVISSILWVKSSIELAEEDISLDVSIVV